MCVCCHSVENYSFVSLQRGARVHSIFNSDLVASCLQWIHNSCLWYFWCMWPKYRNLNFSFRSKASRINRWKAFCIKRINWDFSHFKESSLAIAAHARARERERTTSESTNTKTNLKSMNWNVFHFLSIRCAFDPLIIRPNQNICAIGIVSIDGENAEEKRNTEMRFVQSERNERGCESY